MSPVVAPSIVLAAPAKVNLYLAVGGRREDGYHDVETVLQAVSLADTVTIEPAGTLSVVCDPDIGLRAEENLAYRAAVALGEALGREPRVRITLTKRIPAGGGLGGASSDAAAVLVGLTRLWGISGSGSAAGVSVSDPLLNDVAASLGADVPFFLGGGTALFGGRGDVLVRPLATPRLDLALIKPDEPVPTGAAYAAFDRLLLPEAPGPDAVVSACGDGDVAGVARVLYNNMSEASASLVGAIDDVLVRYRRARGVLGIAVAGSGSTVFALCDSPASADRVVGDARSQDWWAESAKSVTDGVRVLSSGEG